MAVLQVPPMPPSSAELSSYYDMKCRIRDAQELIHEALAKGVSPAEAVRLARRQIEAAGRAKVQYEAELTNWEALPTTAEIGPEGGGRLPIDSDRL